MMIDGNDQYPKELKKSTPEYIRLDFKVLTLNIKCITALIKCGFEGQPDLNKEEYTRFTDKDTLQMFKDWRQRILSEHGLMKSYYLQDNIGAAKYTVSYHDGEQTHSDGSPFFGIACFKSKVKRAKFIATLIEDGYSEI